MKDALLLRDNARFQLEQIRDIETGKEYLSKVRAIEIWAKAEKKDAELQNIIAEQKIRTQRILGQLIREGQEKGEIASQGNVSTLKQFTERTGHVHSDNNTQFANFEAATPKTLSDIGITRNESSVYQTIASIPEEKFESFIKEKKEAVTEAVNELTTAGVVRFAKKLGDELYTPQPNKLASDDDWIVLHNTRDRRHDVRDELNKVCDLTIIPTQRQIDYLKQRASLYEMEYDEIFIASFIMLFDRRAALFEAAGLQDGVRHIIASELQKSCENISKISTIARARYKLVPYFKNRVDGLVSDVKNMELIAVK